jgi:hypothetical protein
LSKTRKKKNRVRGIWQGRRDNKLSLNDPVLFIIKRYYGGYCTNNLPQFYFIFYSVCFFMF